LEITASAPGKLFLLGEYAVTSGHPAVVCSTRRRLGCKITATAGTGQIQIVRSDGRSWTCAHHLESVEQVPQAFRFAAAALFSTRQSFSSSKLVKTWKKKRDVLFTQNCFLW